MDGSPDPPDKLILSSRSNNSFDSAGYHGITVKKTWGMFRQNHHATLISFHLTALYLVALHCTSFPSLRLKPFQFIALRSNPHISSHVSAFHCISWHLITSFYILLHFIASHCPAIHCTHVFLESAFQHEPGLPPANWLLPACVWISCFVYYVSLHCVALHCIAFRLTVFHVGEFHFIALQCISALCISFHSSSLCFNALHSTSLHTLLCSANRFIARTSFPYSAVQNEPGLPPANWLRPACVWYSLFEYYVPLHCITLHCFVVCFHCVAALHAAVSKISLHRFRHHSPHPTLIFLPRLHPDDTYGND